MKNSNIFDLIYKRKSTRTFSGKKLTNEQIDKINDFISKTENLKGINSYVSFELLENKNDEVFGAYGNVTGATHYIAAVAKNDKDSLIDLGFAFERLILFIESINLGTCWLAADSYDRTIAEMSIYLSNNEIVAAIAAIGEKADESTSVETRLRSKYNSDNRIEFDRLFFDAKTGGKIVDIETKTMLNLVRVAPSSLNSQPWRIFIDGDTAHFYIKKTSIPILDYDYQMMDMGVALYHYYVATGKCAYIIINPELNNEFEYLFSVE